MPFVHEVRLGWRVFDGKKQQIMLVLATWADGKYWCTMYINTSTMQQQTFHEGRLLHTQNIDECAEANHVFLDVNDAQRAANEQFRAKIAELEAQLAERMAQDEQ